MNRTNNTHSEKFGMLLMIFASICFAGGGAAMKLIPWNALAINGMRNLLSRWGTPSHRFSMGRSSAGFS